MKIEYWRSKWVSSVTKSGMNVSQQETVLDEVQDWSGTDEQVFKKLYHENNSLKYVQSYYKLVDAEDNRKYLEFVKEYNTITNYYNGGIVD